MTGFIQNPAYVLLFPHFFLFKFLFFLFFGYSKATIPSKIFDEVEMRRSIYFSVLFLSLAGLALENSLTRIFSVTMWYHYAFMAISVAMLGMSTGAVKVYVSDYILLDDDKLYELIAKYSRFFSLFTILSLFTLLSIPFVPRESGIGFFTSWLIYGIAAIPFYFEGVAVSLILATKFTKKANRLYSADMIGAAAGSLLFFALLSITDAVTAIILTSVFGLFASFAVSRKKSDITLIVLILLFGIFNHGSKYFRIEWVKVDEGKKEAVVESNLEWESWTPFSRITVAPYEGGNSFGWGISYDMLNKHHPNFFVEQKNMKIDSAAATIITNNRLPIEGLIHLRYDITNIAHYLFPNSRVGIIGVGGGRDILSALHFNQKEVWGIEINRRIIEAVTNVYSFYTYPFLKMPNVHIIEDEARNFFERNDFKFDIIQASLIDSWAATASGAFVLTENTLYTMEGWRIFFSKLSDKGALTMSRWYFPKRPGELLRLTNLAYEMLLKEGIKEPQKHIVLVGMRYSNSDFGSGTIVVSKKPFDDNILDRLESIADLYGFEKLIVAGRSQDPTFKKLMDPEARGSFIAGYPLDLTPPTDDNPFFFNMLKPAAVIRGENLESEGVLSTNLMAVRNLLSLIVIVFVLAVCLIIIPLIKRMKMNVVSALCNRYSLYFVSLGIAYMLIEISLIQKFSVFLGHPTYSILVVLFTMLLFSGIGSYFSKSIREKFGIKALFILLLTVVAIIGTTNMYVLPHFSTWAIAPRIIYSFSTMAVIGFFMGMPFPTGLSLLSGEQQKSAAWFWGVNGAASVVSSVTATAVSIFYGISSTFFIGLFFYATAFAAITMIEKSLSGKQR